MITLLISLLVLLLVIYVAFAVVDKLFPGEFNYIIKLVLGLIFFLILLSQIGLFGGSYTVYPNNSVPVRIN